MKLNKNYLRLLMGMVMLGLFLAACSEQTVEVPVTREVTVEVTREVQVEVTVEVPGPEVEVTRIVEVMVEPVVPVVPFEELWAESGHADKEAAAFNRWNTADPAVVPAACARCHSTPGYRDYVGADGSAAGSVEVEPAVGTTIACDACHNDATAEMDSVVFPSGVEVTNLGPEARCMQCHQGRHSTVSVNQSITDAGLTDDDTISEDLGFSNIHYYAAGATLYGSVTHGGYEYEGKAYDAKLDHVPGYNTCVGCHNPHSLEVRLDECQVCHTNVETAEDLVNIRMNGSLVDYDGDGDLEEGVYFEIEGMRDVLYTALRAYAAEISGKAIAYNPDAYPYFFIDLNDNGTVDEDEANSDNRFNAWTGRLAKAAYNYQVSMKDPGRFAHGGKYIIQLLYDSIENLNEKLSAPIDMSTMHRIDSGHFAGSEYAFRDWDDTGVVNAPCSKCHTANGLPTFLTMEGVTGAVGNTRGPLIMPQPTSNGLNCTTCHNDVSTFTRFEVEEVLFPSGARVTTGDLDSNLCINCHQGRESTVSVNRAINNLEPDTISENLRFRNIHYFAAGATLFGGDVQGGYQFAEKEYVGRNEHVGAKDVCIECHTTHSLKVMVEDCADCHENTTITSVEDLANIRSEDNSIDYDGDGDVTEGISHEIETMEEALMAALQAYVATVPGANPIVYYAGGYPYFFNDTNANGVADPEESIRDNGYNTWTPRLLQSAYNYQYAHKDPGGFAHNGMYIIQLLYDSIENVGGDVTGMTRPEVPAP